MALAQPLEEQKDATVGYPTVKSALQGLRARRDLESSIQNGWTIMVDNANRTLWSFDPEGNPAYPAVVKRQVVEQAGGVFVNMKILCEAKKDACDKLVIDFQKLNDAMTQRQNHTH